MATKYPVTEGWSNFHRMTRNDLVKNMNALFEKGMSLTACPFFEIHIVSCTSDMTDNATDRQGRARGEKAITIKNVSDQPDKELCNLPTPDSYDYVMSWMKKYPTVRNEITVKRCAPQIPSNPAMSKILMV
jgi:hypothetical protein